jgi:GNAT superfamily N-acetyltransferase
LTKKFFSCLAIEQYAAERDSIDEITNLLHQAYRHLAEMGFNYIAATQSSLITAARIDSGITYIARSQSGIVGTITYYPRVAEDKDEPSFFKSIKVCHFGQFAVCPELQGSGIGSRLLDCVEDKAVKDYKKEIACDTAENAIHLVEYYKRRGYRKIGHQQWPCNLSQCDS